MRSTENRQTQRWKYFSHCRQGNKILVFRSLSALVIATGSAMKPIEKREVLQPSLFAVKSLSTGTSIAYLKILQVQKHLLAISRAGTLRQDSGATPDLTMREKWNNLTFKLLTRIYASHVPFTPTLLVLSHGGVLRG
jgi:hypothetical protein